MPPFLHPAGAPLLRSVIPRRSMVGHQVRQLLAERVAGAAAALCRRGDGTAPPLPAAVSRDWPDGRVAWPAAQQTAGLVVRYRVRQMRGGSHHGYTTASRRVVTHWEELGAKACGRHCCRWRQQCVTAAMAAVVSGYILKSVCNDQLRFSIVSSTLQRCKRSPRPLATRWRKRELLQTECQCGLLRIQLSTRVMMHTNIHVVDSDDILLAVKIVQHCRRQRQSES